MKPRDDFCNGDEGSGSDSEAGSEGDTEVWVEDAAAPARALAALNALRKSRQHYDVVLVAAGAAGGEAGEVPAHRALLAAASPYLLQALAAPASPAPEAPAGPTAIRVDGVEADALRELVEYMYTGRLSARDAAGARRLYLCAWRLRLEAARVALAERLARRPLPADCLDTRALPDLPPHCLHQLDAYIADNFDLLCGGGALATLPLVRIEMLRASSACGGGEAAQQVADAALAWLRDRQPTHQLEELWARGHLVFVDAGGALRDCGELPAARGDAPEIREYRRAAELRAERPRRVAGVSRPLAGVTLGARDPRPDTAVLAARASGGGGVTRALLLLRGQLLAARISWREMDTGVSPGGPLGQAGEQRATLTEGRCALGSAVLGARLIVCGGYDRARVLRAAEAYSADSNEWRPLPDMRTARARFPAARLGGSLYVVGGSDGHDELDSVDVYREDKGWSSVARLPLAASHAGAAGDEVQGRLHVVGGWAAGRSLRAVHTYDPGTDGWSDAPPLATGRSQCAAVVWGRALWALGGCDSWHCLATTEYLQLDEPHATWTPGAALPTARRSVGGCVWRGALVSAGGSDGAASLRRVDCLTSPTDTAWKPLPSLRRARAALGLHELRDVLYAVGGFDGKEFLSCVECLYSPDDEWTTLCAPPPRAPISAATVPQGIDLPQGVDVPRETDLPRDNDGANSPDTERAEKAVKEEPPKKEPERLENGAATAAECE